MSKKIIDKKRICESEGCNNLGAWSKAINFKVYRSPLCDKHRHLKYRMKRNCNPASKMNAITKFKKRGRASKCEICGWNGPCDVHRKIPMGPYNFENMMSSCPNCHRLIHRGMIDIDDKDPRKWKRK